jgi:hypothetical protein
MSFCLIKAQAGITGMKSSVNASPPSATKKREISVPMMSAFAPGDVCDKMKFWLKAVTR